MVRRDRRKPDGDWVARVFDCLSMPTLILRPSREIVDVNASFLGRFGLEKGEIVGKACHDFFFQSREPCPFERCPLARVLADRAGHSALVEVRTESGDEKWDNRFFSPILDAQGEVQYVIETIHDVSRTKLLERELSGAREFAQKLIQCSTSAMIAADRKGRILLMNRAAEELTGYSLQEARKRVNAKDLYPPGRAKEVMKMLRDEEIGGRGKLPCIRVSLVNAQGEEIPVELTASILYEGDKEIATMAVFNDLREKLEQEERMQKMLVKIAQAEKMASLGQLAAGVAHEINNPLTGIIFFSSMMLDTLDDADPWRKHLQCIYEDAKRCGRIVKSLLAYSRQTSPGEEIFPVNQLVEESLDLIRDRKVFMNVETREELSPDVMLIKGDREHLSQVIVNLVMNAVDAMELKGTLTLRTYRDLGARKVFIEVSDTGCGIPVENLSRIFDPFFTTKAPGKGTGLGLSTAYGFVQESGGEIWVKETGPKGTTFVVELPLYRAADETPDAEDPCASGRRLGGQRCISAAKRSHGTEKTG